MQLCEENESVRPLLPGRGAGVSGVGGGVMFDWGLLAPPVLFLFVNRLPGNVVIIVAEASICSFGGGVGRRWMGELPSFQIHFPRCLWEAAGWRGWMLGGGGSSAQPCFIYPGVSAHSATRLSALVPANGSNPAGFNRQPGSPLIHFALWLATKRAAFWRRTLHWVTRSGVWSERHKIHKQPGGCGSGSSSEATGSGFAYRGATL